MMMSEADKKKMMAGMQLRRNTINEYCAEAKNAGITNNRYYCPELSFEDMGRYSVDGEESVWGPAIADGQAFQKTPACWKISSNGEDSFKNSGALYQALERSRSDSVRCMTKVLRGRPCYAVNTDVGIKIFDYAFKGDIISVKTQETWYMGDTPLPSDVAAKCDEAASDKDNRVPVRFEHEGRFAFAMLAASGEMRLFNFVKDEQRTATKRTGHQFKSEYGAAFSDGLRTEVMGDFSSNDLNRISKYEVSEIFNISEVLSVIVSGMQGVMVLNHDGLGKHATVSRIDGFSAPLFKIRTDNVNETRGLVRMDRVKAVVHTEDKQLKLENMHDISKQAGKLAAAYGLDKDVDLSSPSDMESCNSIRFQAYIVPGGNDTEVLETLFSYQASDAAPDAVYAYSTTFGTSWATSGKGKVNLQPCTVDDKGQVSAFNLSIKANKDKKVGDDATYTAADNAKNVAEGRGMAVKLGPVGMDAVANATLLTQWPVIAADQGNTRDPVFPTSNSPLGSSYVSDDYGSQPAYRSLAAPAPMGELYSSTTGYGSYTGKAKRMSNGTLKRNHKLRPTMTYSRFYSVDAPKEGDRSLLPGEYNVTRDQVYKIIKMLDEAYATADKTVKLFDKDGDHIKVTHEEFMKDPIAQVAMGASKKPRVELPEVMAPAMSAVVM